MSLNNAIKLAIWKGGYTPFGRIDYSPKAWILRRIKPHYHKHLLKPEFWQALGRALGWGKQHEEFCYTNMPGGKCDCVATTKWLYEWHRFIDHIAAEKSPDEFFSNLIKE